MGESDPVVTGLAAAAEDTVFAAADDGIFRSSDGGAHWQNISAGLSGHFARAVVAGDSGLLAATNAGVYRAPNGGSWLPPANDAVPMLALAASGDTVLAAPQAGGLLISRDGGISWTPTSFPPGRAALSLALSPGFATDGTILVGSDDGVWRSADGGENWTQVGLQGNRIAALAVSPNFAADRTIFAGSASGQGVFLSTDGGDTWSSSAGSYIESLAISPQFASDGTVLAGTAGDGVLRSTDAGRHWAPADGGLHASVVRQVSVADTTAAVCGEGGVSLYQHGSWSEFQPGTPFINGCALAGRDLYAATETVGVEESSDDGASWRQTSLSGQATAVAVSPDYGMDGTVVAAAGYVYVSEDRGRDWTQASGMTGNDVRRFRFSPTFSLDHTMFAATIAHGAYRSEDGGKNWLPISHDLPSDQITDILPSPQYDRNHILFASTAGDGVWRSYNAGLDWAPLPMPPVRVVTALGWDGDTLLAGTEKGLFEWTGSWLRLAPDWDEYVTDLDVQVNGATQTIWLATLGDGLWKEVSAPAPPSLTATAVPPPPPRPVPTSGPAYHLKLSAWPRPLVVGRPALIRLSGPPGAPVSLVLSSRGWHRSYQGFLDQEGIAAFGFAVPHFPVTVLARAQYGAGLHYHVTLPVVSAKTLR